MKLLLHACCGPCALEPVRILQEAGHELTIAYLSSNISPKGEYLRRRDELATWAAEASLPIIEGVYNPALWEATAGHKGAAALKAAQGDILQCATTPTLREARCRACYRLRFEEAANIAAVQNFDGIGTTLSVSPYQHTTIIAEELQRAAEQTGLVALFEDYRPYYNEATRRSQDRGMYRQNYCGCSFSNAEAAAEREHRRNERAAARAEERKLHEAERLAAENDRAAKRQQKIYYAQKQAHKRALLKQLKAKSSLQKRDQAQ